MAWNDERVDLLKKMWSEGQSASQIAKELGGVTRNAVIGKVHRLGLSNRNGAGPVAAEVEITEEITVVTEPEAPAAAAPSDAPEPETATAPEQDPEQDAEETEEPKVEQAGRRPGDVRFLVLRPAGSGRQALLRGACRGRVPTRLGPPRPQALGPLA